MLKIVPKIIIKIVSSRLALEFHMLPEKDPKVSRYKDFFTSKCIMWTNTYFSV